jgi:hypothetical protein
MGGLKDISGKRFGSLTALSHISTKRKWLCKCDCGKIKDVNTQHLRLGTTRSCGCLNSEMSATRQFKHGKINTPEYVSWNGLKGRCLNPRNAKYPHYGGRGIKVCERWMVSFQAFLKDMGTRPTVQHSIERKDINGNYEPSNCVWATADIQSRNKTTNRNITFNGQTMIISDWAKKLAIPVSTLINRVNRWPLDRAMTEPVQLHSKTKIHIQPVRSANRDCGREEANVHLGCS